MKKGARAQHLLPRSCRGCQSIRCHALRLSVVQMSFRNGLWALGPDARSPAVLTRATCFLQSQLARSIDLVSTAVLLFVSVQPDLRSKRKICARRRPMRQQLTDALPQVRGSSFCFLLTSRADCYPGSWDHMRADCAAPPPRLLPAYPFAGRLARQRLMRTFTLRCTLGPPPQTAPDHRREEHPRESHEPPACPTAAFAARRDL